jgi:hypothetical protein
MRLALAFIIGFFVFSSALSAQVVKRGKYDSYVIQLNTEKPVVVSLETQFETLDACNSYQLDGYMREVQLAPDVVWSVEQSFMADFEILTTELGCDPLDNPRQIVLKTKAFEIKPVQKRIHAKILVPESLKLKVEIEAE